MGPEQLEQEIKETEAEIEKKTSESEQKKAKLEKKIKIASIFAWTLVISGFVVSAYGIYKYFCPEPQNNFELNHLGDFMAGTVASLWGLAGLIFIYIAFLGQKQQMIQQQIEIMLSQKEVKLTRLQLVQQNREMVEQNETLKQQRFENTFFKLLENHNSIVNAMHIENPGMDNDYSTNGRNCFKLIQEEFIKEVQRIEEKSQRIHLLKIERTIELYEDFFGRHAHNLGHYFKNLYHIIKFVDETYKEEEPKITKRKVYTNFVRAQLSTPESALLFYNCLSKYAKKKFKPLAEKYSLLKTMDDDLLISKEHRNSYDKKAFAAGEHSDEKDG